MSVWFWGLVYPLAASETARHAYNWLASVAWVVPQWVLYVLAFVAGALWPFTLLVLAFAWAWERTRGG